jgi:hypothetical protein
MKIAVQSLLLLFLSARQVLGEENEYGPVTDDIIYGGYGGYGVPSVEDCINAVVIDTSAFFGESGDTNEANVQGFPETCPLVGESTRGVWYTLEGDGACYNATTLGSQFDTILSVYTGEADCQDLACLTENDDGVSSGYGYGYGGGFGVTSNVVWRTEVGQAYYILLGGLGSSSGAYRFSLEVRGKRLCCVVPLLALVAVAVTNNRHVFRYDFLLNCAYVSTRFSMCYRLHSAPNFLPMMTAPTRLLFPVCPILTLIIRLLASQDLAKRSRALMSMTIREESGTRLWAMDYVTTPRREGRAISTLLYRSTLESQVAKTWLALSRTTTVALI